MVDKQPLSPDQKATSGLAPAEIYDQLFVPTFFSRFTDLVLQASHVTKGQTVLDVGCGTGALAVAASDRVLPRGKVSGLDANEEMLEVARNKDIPIDWNFGTAEQLPFDDDTFDSVISQFALMYVEDKPKALQEMRRVLKPGGRLAVLVPDAIDHSPGFSVAAELLHRLFDEVVAEGMRSPFQSGNPEHLREVCDAAGLHHADIVTVNGAGRFDSPAAFMKVEGACAWSIGGLLDDQQLELLYKEADQAFRPFQNEDGSITINTPCLILQASAG